MRDSHIKKRTIDNSSMRDRWLLSYADLMTLLLGLFIVLYAASDKERAQMVAQSFSSGTAHTSGILDGSESPKKKNDQAVSAALLKNPLLIEKTRMVPSNDGLTISLSEAGFFAPGGAAMGNDARAVVLAITETLKDHSSLIRIEGHTDSTPISNARYPSNWELSTARASNVLATLVEFGVAPERLSAAGYAGFRPIQDNSTQEGRAQNRRVDVVILSGNADSEKTSQLPLK